MTDGLDRAERDAALAGARTLEQLRSLAKGCRACDLWAVALGATAAQALLGRNFRVTRQHGEVLESDLGPTLGTIHPSAVLRAPGDVRDETYAGLVADLNVADRWIRSSASA